MGGAGGEVEDLLPWSVSSAIIRAAPPALGWTAHVTGSPPLNSSTSLISLSKAFSSLTTRCDSSRVPSAPSATQRC